MRFFTPPTIRTNRPCLTLFLQVHIIYHLISVLFYFHLFFEKKDNMTGYPLLTLPIQFPKLLHYYVPFFSRDLPSNFTCSIIVTNPDLLNSYSQGESF